MKMWKRWKAVLLAGMMACTAVAASVPAIGTLNAQAEEDTNNDDWLHAVGSRLYDKDGNDLYPEIRRRALAKNDTEKHTDMVRYEYIRRLGYYCTESSEHNAEYNPFFIKRNYPELIDRYNIPLD